MGLVFAGKTSTNKTVLVEKTYNRDTDPNGKSYFSAAHGFGYSCPGKVTMGNAESLGSIEATFANVKLQPFNLNGTDIVPAPGQGETRKSGDNGDRRTGTGGCLSICASWAFLDVSGCVNAVLYCLVFLCSISPFSPDVTLTHTHNAAVSRMF